MYALYVDLFYACMHCRKLLPLTVILAAFGDGTLNMRKQKFIECTVLGNFEKDEFG